MASVADVVVLGAGPAGLGAADRLARTGRRALVLEAAPRVGGLAGSTEIDGVRVDHGSHRLHPSVAPEILATLRGLPGVDLQRRPRHGRIRIADRWVAFPLRAGDAAWHLPGRLVAGMAVDAALAPLRTPRADTFDEVLRAGVGPTLTRRFYLPYARKIWGVAPDALTGDQARRRVGANSLTTIARRVLRGHREPATFWYPRTGFGALSEGLAASAMAHGATVRLGARVVGVRRASCGWSVHTADGAEAQARHVWSTLPVPTLARMLDPAPPRRIADAASGLRYRAMLLVYVSLDRDRYTAFDAHYLPEDWTPVTRLSEPKNYRDGDGTDPTGRTVLCAELPCHPGDRWWDASDAALADVVRSACAVAGLPTLQPRTVTVVRRRHAYPIATRDSVARLGALEHWVGAQPDVLTLGRQGLFAHDNTHHALAMAWAAADALRPDGSLDRAAWDRARLGFRAHVVED